MAIGFVIGAGPAGLMAAQVMAGAGLQVTIAEAKPTPARKFLMAGKSGLNLTKDEAFDAFLNQYDCPEFLKPALDAFGPSQVQDFAKNLGQEVFTGSTKRVFPKAMKASPLLRAWLAKLDEMGVQLLTGHKWLGLPEQGAAHQFATADGTIEIAADVTILALGGGSWARLGSDGAWADGFKAQGVQVAPFKPMNMGFQLDWSKHMAAHFGTPLKNITLHVGDRIVPGEAVIAKSGIEGGVIYTVSDLLRDGAKASIDLLPDLTLEQIEMRMAAQNPKTSLANRLRKALKLSSAKLALLQEWGRPLPADAKALAQLIKSLPLHIQGPAPIDQAISTGGGVAFAAIDETLMLNTHPGIYCVGEMLDWEAPTGGYLITACLAQGAWAGKAAAAYASRNA